MKYLLPFLVIAAIFGVIYGFYIRAEDPKVGEFLIGISIAITFFVTMPIFIYRRWKRLYVDERKHRKNAQLHERQEVIN